MICHVCYDKRRHGQVSCTVTGCKGSIENKKWQLCNYHNDDRLAPNQLTKYINSYTSPFPRNVSYFVTLATKSTAPHGNTHETTVRGRDLVRYRAIGEFLKIYELPEVLTWQAIHEALPKLGKRGRTRSKFIRSGLLELGNLFVHERLSPDWTSYLDEQRLDKYLKSTPSMFVEYVAAFEKWASEGMLNPKLDINLHESQPLTITTDCILKIVKAIVIFLDWCVKRNISALADINRTTVASYKETLFWQLECRNCRKRIQLDVAKTNEICSNRECQARNSYVKIRRLVERQLTGTR